MTHSKTAFLPVSLFAAALIFCGLFFPSAPSDAYADEAVEINTAEEFIAFEEEVNGGDSKLGAVYSLCSDIDLSAAAFEPIAQDKNTVVFQGTFNGGGHTVTVAYSSQSADVAVGLFGYIGSSGTVNNLRVAGELSGSAAVGGIAGVNGGRIFACVNSASVTSTGTSTARRCGGITGENGGAVVSCVNFGVITGSSTVGGLAGINRDGANISVSRCVNLGEVDASGSLTAKTVGGLIGKNLNTVTDSYAYCDVNLPSGGAAQQSGALIGYLGGLGSSARVYCVDGESIIGQSGVPDSDAFSSKTLYEFLSSDGVPFTGMTRASYVTGYGYLYIPDYFANGSEISDAVLAAKFETLLFASGDGTEDSPFSVVTANQWKLFSDNAELFDYDGEYIRLDCDGTLSLGSVTPIGSAAVKFCGTLDGNNKTIDFSVSSTDENTGLFACVDGATVKNLTLDGTVTGARYTGALAGIAGSGGAKLENLNNRCTVSGGTYTGGLLGATNSLGAVSVLDCSNRGAVAGSNYVGGLIGLFEGYAAVDGASNYASVSSPVTGAQCVGGVFGKFSVKSDTEKTYANMHNEGAVNAGGGKNVGGVIGAFASSSAAVSTLVSVSNRADVTGRFNVGGLVGDASDALAITSFASFSKVKAVNYIGGAVGYAEAAVTLGKGLFVGSLTEDTSIKKDETYKIDEIVYGSANVSEVYYNADASDNSNAHGAVKSDTVGMTDGTLFDGEAYWNTSEMTVTVGRYPCVNAALFSDITALGVSYFDGTEQADGGIRYLIASVQALKNFSRLCNGYAGYGAFAYRQTADIALKTPFTPISEFSGKYYGGQFTVTGLSVTSSAQYVGFFGKLTDSATVDGLCVASGSITADGTGETRVGGIAGYIGADAAVSCCYAVSDVSGGGYAGGIAGENLGSVSVCFAYGSVSGICSGGIAGKNTGMVSDCFSSAKVSGTEYAGGIIGALDGSLARVYASRLVEGSACAGGLAGQCSASSSFSYCYVTAEISGAVGETAAFVGDCADGAAFVSCYYDSDTLGALKAYPECADDSPYKKSFPTFRTSESAMSGYVKADTSYNEAFDAYNFWHLAAFDAFSDNPAVSSYAAKSAELPIFGGNAASDDERGTVNNPYLVSTANQFATISVLSAFTDFNGKYFEITADIDMSMSTVNGGNMYAIGYYESDYGTGNYAFDGKIYSSGRYKISNVDVKRSVSKTAAYSTSFLGVFAYTGADFELRNLVFEGSVSGVDYVGSLVGFMNGGTITDCYSKITVAATGTNVGGIAARVKSSGAKIVNTVYYGAVSGTAYVYGLVGMPSEAAVIDTTNSWYVVDGDMSDTYLHNGCGSVLYVCANGTDGGNIAVEYSEGKGHGFKLSASGDYRGFILNTNDVSVAAAYSAAYYPISGASVAAGTSVTYFARFCLSLTPLAGGLSDNPNASFSTAGSGYYYPGQTVKASLVWKNDGYVFSVLNDADGNAVTCDLANSADDLTITFEMGVSTVTLNAVIAEVAPNAGSLIIEYTASSGSQYGGDSRLSKVCLDNYSVAFYGASGTEADALMHADTYTVKVRVKNAENVTTGLYSETYVIEPRMLAVFTERDYSAYSSKVYDGTATKKFVFSTADAGCSDFVDNVVSGENVTVGFTAIFGGVNAGDGISVVLKNFTAEGGNAADYRFSDKDEVALGNTGVIQPKPLVLTVSSAVSSGGKYIASAVYSNEKPVLKETYTIAVNWIYSSVGDPSWTEAKGYHVGLYGIEAEAVSATDANNYAVSLAQSYYVEIVPYTVTSVTYVNAANLVYDGKTKAVSAYYAGVDDSQIQVGLDYFKAISVTAGAAVSSDTYYELSSEGMVFTADTVFIDGKTYYTAVSEIKHAGNYCASPVGSNSDYTLSVGVKPMTVARSSSGGKIDVSFSLDGNILADGGTATVNDSIGMNFSGVDALSDYDAEYSVELSDTARGNFEVTEYNGGYRLVPVEYGTSVKFRLAATGATDYEDRYSDYFTLKINAATLYAALKEKVFVYGDAINLELAFFEDADKQTEVAADDIGGLNRPTIQLGRAASEIGERGVIYSGGSSGGYVFSYLDGQITINRRPINVTVAENSGKTYGESAASEIISYVVTENDGDGNPVEKTVLPNGDKIVLNGALARESGESVGGYDISEGTMASENPNYIITFSLAGGQFVISQRDIELAVKDGQGKEYGDADGQIELVVKDGYSLVKDTAMGIGDTVDLFYSAISCKRKAGEEIGIYAYEIAINYSAAAKLDYNVISVDTVDKYYTVRQAVPAVSVEITGAAYYGDNPASLQYSARATRGLTVITGKYTVFTGRNYLLMTDSSVAVKFVPDDSHYAEVTVRGVALSVQKRPVTLDILVKNGDSISSAVGAQFTYDAAEITKNDFTYAVGDTVEDNDAYTVEIELSGDVKNVTDAGFTVTASLDSGYYALSKTVSVKCLITKAAVTVTAENAAITEGDAFSPEIVYSGFAGSDTKAVLAKFAEVPNLDTAVKGYYSLIPSGAKAQNYDFIYVSGLLVVNGKTASSDGITVKGTVSPMYTVTAKTVDSQSEAFSDIAEAVDKGLGASIVRPLNYEMTQYVAVETSGSAGEEFVYTVRLGSAPSEGDIIYVTGADGKVTEAEYTVNTSGGETYVTFSAGAITGVSVYSKKGIENLLKGYIPHIAAGTALIIILIVSIAAAKAKKRARREHVTVVKRAVLK